MDKLKPILQHRFWILLGLAIPLGLWGYYSANSTLKAATDKRKTELDDLKVPTGNEENPRYSEGLKVINDAYEKSVKAEQRRLWTEQKARMDWPPSMHEYLPPKYRDHFTNDTRAAINYRGEYEPSNRGELGPLMKELYEGIDPVTLTPTGGFKGRVYVDPRIIPRHTFGQFTIPYEKIWDAQEDIWFLRLLFDAVRNLNKDSGNVATAPLRMITELKLKGGDGQSTVLRTAAAGSFGAMSGGTDESYAEMMSDRSEYEQEDGGGAFGQAIGGGKVGFEVAEEFGSDAKAAAATTTDTTSVSTDLYGGMGARTRELLRYIEFEKHSEFRQRGFYLGVIIDQTKIPDFLVELTNAPWPIRIVRFQVGPNPYSTSGPRSSGSRFGGLLGMQGEMGSDFLGGGYSGGGYPGSGYPGGEASSYESSGYPGYQGGSGFTEDYTTDVGASGYPGAGTYPGAGSGPLHMAGAGGGSLAKTLEHPDLVQLYVCGVITLYNPPAEEAAPASTEPPTEQVAPIEAPTSPPGDGTPVEEPAPPASETAAPGASSDPNAAAPQAEPSDKPATPAADALPADAPASAPAPAGDPPAASASAAGPGTGT